MKHEASRGLLFADFCCLCTPDMKCVSAIIMNQKTMMLRTRILPFLEHLVLPEG